MGHPLFQSILFGSVLLGEQASSLRRFTAISKLALRKLDQLDNVTMLRSLGVPPGNRLEALSGDRLGQFSIRINEQWRLCFRWTDDGPEDVEIVDYHRG